MKKALFTWMAAIVIGMTLAACGEKKANQDAGEAEKESFEVVVDEKEAPVKQMVSVLKQFGALLKDTHINSKEDAEAFKTKAMKFKDAVEAASKKMEKEMEGMDEKDKLKYAGEMMTVMKDLEDMQKDMESDIERLKKECEKAGVDMDKIL